jgi:uncharacterized protein (DUF3084 family)|tara:strand:- start:3468 stop:3719 length:252 start_codon:yes stop_codon:yes gene_type:complete
MADNNSISLETLQEQQKNLSEVVAQLSATRSQLEEQLTSVRNNLSTNAGALQYANALIQSITGEEVAAAAPPDEALEDEEVAL